MIADHISFCIASHLKIWHPTILTLLNSWHSQRGCDICSSPSKASKALFLNPAFYQEISAGFPGISAVFPGISASFPGISAFFPGIFAPGVFNFGLILVLLWSFRTRNLQKQRHIIYDMMVARFAGGGGNLSAANCFFSLRWPFQAEMPNVNHKNIQLL